MKICIDARWIFPEISGIGLYTQELIRALAEIDHANEYILLFNRQDVATRTLPSAPPNFKMQLVDYGLFSIKNQFCLPRLVRKLGVDVYHSTNYMMPLYFFPKHIRRIVTIHDLIPLLFPDHAPKAKKTRLFPLYKKLMFEVGQRADSIIAVSESTRRDIVRALNVPENKVVAIPEGVSPVYKPGKKSDRKIILYVGRRDPYKNLVTLIEAFGQVRAAGVEARLRIIGPADGRYPEAPQRAADLNLNSFIDWIGYATPDQLIHEYQQASVYVLPSRYEGFGLTVLEAMACGTPVICSNTSSLPEVAGDAALMTPPGHIEELVFALKRILTDSSVAVALQEKGLNQASRFSWRKAAELTLQHYRSVLQ